MNPMSLMLKIAKNPRSILGMGMLLMIAALYILGPKIGLVGWKRLVAVVVLVLLFGVIQVLLAARASKKKKEAADDLEKSLIIEADQNVAGASGDQKSAREDAGRELRAAIGVLKESQLADGRGGKAALYVLPWFMVLGTDESGKSEVIRNSGLQRPDRGPGDLTGIGSSPNCEWWFTNQAVIMEADRRFVDFSEEKKADPGWQAFLELLAKHHSKSPLNGVVITISAMELLQDSKADIESRARLLRRRLDSMRQNLRQVFPVYVLVTKLDLLLGFDGFFSEMGKEAGAQIFGATFHQRNTLRSGVEKVFQEEFSLLNRTLRKRRLLRLVREENSALKDGTYLFPLEFQGLRDPLKFFLSALCEDNAYGANPLLRGFYFVASGGGGQVADVVLSEVSQVIGLPGTVVPTPQVKSATEGQPFFLKDFFRKVLVSDRHIARPTRGAAQQALALRRTLQYTCLTALAVLGVLLAVSFGRNLALVSNTRVLADQARNVILSGTELADINQSLKELDALRDQLIYLDDLEHGRPLTLGLGMYQGKKIKPIALDIYLERLLEVLVKPSRQELYLWLNKSRPRVEDPAASTRYYYRYRVYRALFDPLNGNPDIIAPELESLWSNTYHPEDTLGLTLARIKEHIRFALVHPDAFTRFCGADQPNRDLKRQGNAFVQENWRPETFYNHLVSEVNELTRGFWIDPARHSGLVSVPPPGSDISRVEVPGSFTKAGWDEQVRQRILNSDSDLREDWLLREVFEGQTTGIRNRLLDYYVSDYKKYWNEFLASVDLPRVDQLDLVIADLEELLEGDSPYVQVLEEASDNLKFNEDEGKVGKEIVKSLERLEDSFVALHSFVNNKAIDDGDPPRDGFKAGVGGIIGKLMDMRGEEQLAATAEFTKSVFTAPGKEDPIHILRKFAYDHCNPVNLGSQDSRKALQTYLSRPAASAWRTCLEATARHFDGMWSKDVWEVFNSDLKLKYPCIDASSEASTEDYASFFSPEGVLLQFIEQNMKVYFKADGSLAQVYGEKLGIGPETIAAVAKAYLLGEVMFDEAGQLSVDCDLTAKQIQTSSGVPPSFKASQVKVGHQSLIYYMGPPKNLVFHWPDENREAEARVAVLCLDDGCEKPTPNKVPSSEWALFRLLDQADLPGSGQKGNSFNIRWEQGVENSYKIAVPYRLNTGSQRHPFRKGFLRFSCPRSLRH